MAMETVSAKRNRVYARKFDHEEAVVRHAAGESASALAREYGVSPRAVLRVVTPGMKESDLVACRRWRTTVCEVCGGPAMKIVGGKAKYSTDGRILCLRCRANERRERLRFNEHGTLIAVRCASLDCASGERWQPPSHFARGTRHREVRPGGIHSSCRACNTRGKRELREKTRVPCSHGCGRMVDGINRRMPDKPPECQPCAMKRVNAARRKSADVLQPSGAPAGLREQTVAGGGLGAASRAVRTGTA